MKIATSLFLGLGLCSPAFALRGSAQHVAEKENAQRELVEAVAAADETLEEVAVAEAVAWSVDKFALFSDEARKGKSKMSNKVRIQNTALPAPRLFACLLTNTCAASSPLGQG